MTLLSTLAHHITGEFENRDQAIDNPAWFVHLRLWQRPVNLFAQDSMTIFAEQANALKLDQPYRQRLMRLQAANDEITVQYYMFKDPSRVKGAGQNPALLENLTEADIEHLPGCFLQVTTQERNSAGIVQSANRDIHFTATQPPDCCCRFSFQGSIIQVALGFEATSSRFLTYDKGIDPDTDKPLWGAIVGAYEYTKRQQY